MSNTNISPVFKFNFEQTHGTLTDLTGNGYGADVKSATACTPVADDPEMGRCMLFDGTTDSYFTLKPTATPQGPTDLSNGLTMTAWVNAETNGDCTPLVIALTSGQNLYNLKLQLNGLTPVGYGWSQISGTDAGEALNATKSLESGTWHHVALTVDAKGHAALFIDGIQRGEDTSHNYGLAGNLSTIYGAIGKDLTTKNSATPTFKGMMAWMTLYNGPLGATEILADMAEGQAKRAASFRQSMPIDFKLYSDNGGAESPIMFIEDEGAGENLNLRIINNSTKPVIITKNNDPVSTDNYHFQLHFRPGVLSNNFLNKYAVNSDKSTTTETASSGATTKVTKLLANNPNWTAVVNENPSGTDTISFLYNAETPLTLAKGQDHLIVISAVNASATGGSRNTNAELRYANIVLGTVSAANKPIQGHRKQNISIVNHSGDKDIPLRAEIIGNASVMTYAKPAKGSTVNNPPQSELSFRITNTSLKPLPLALPGSSDGATQFTLSIDVQPTGSLVEWALIDQGAVAEIGLSNNNSTWKIDPVSTAEALPNTKQWTISNQSVQQILPGGVVSFQLKGIECSLPAGSSVVTISYSNIPGHWDGQFELPVRKSPMAFKQNLVGINIQDPKGSLHIEEENNITPIIIGQKSKDGSSTYISSETISIGTKIPIENVPLAVNDDSGNIALSVNGNGYVGIGTDNPQVPLHIDTNTSYSSDFFGGATSGYHYGAGGGGSVTQEPVLKPNTSIFANGSIIALNYLAMSDQRAKEHLSLSNPNQSLATLLKLKVSDYQYIDFVGKGTDQKKGLIAQQVKEHFPQAVSDENTDFIPNIYAMATDCQWQPITKHLRIELEKAHDLKVGDRIRLIAENGFEEKEVITVPDDKSFVVAEWEKPVDKLFVFGKEVNDFHTVDYDQVAMLGVSAIQALHQKVDSLEQEVAALKKQNQRLELERANDMAEIRKELIAFKVSVSKHEN